MTASLPDALLGIGEMSVIALAALLASTLVIAAWISAAHRILEWFFGGET